MTFGQAMGLLIFSSTIGSVAGIFMGVFIVRQLTEKVFTSVSNQNTILITAMRKTMDAMRGLAQESEKLAQDLQELIKRA